MAYMVARTEKRKVGSLTGYQNHVDRKTINHSNKEIDPSKSHLNYDLVGHRPTTSFHVEFMDYIQEHRTGTRAVRKDAVVLQDWLISSSQAFFDALTPQETRRYFETAVNFFAEQFGRENIRFATVHLDEKTPHMHMGIVPLKDGKLTAKTIFNRECLRKVQQDLPLAFQKAGFDIQRGEEKSEKVHMHPEEYKATLKAAKEQAKEILQKAEKDAETSRTALTEQAYRLWEKDWEETEEHFPDFHFDEFTPKVVEITGEMDLFDTHNLKPSPKAYPRAHHLSLEKVLALFFEKGKQLQTYIALQARKMASKVSELPQRVKVLKEEKATLETKIEGKYEESENLNALLQAKIDFSLEQSKQADLAVSLPDYVKVSKLNKNMLLVPRDKWEAKHVSANMIGAYAKSMQAITRVERQIQQGSPVLEKSLSREKELRQSYNALYERYSEKSHQVELLEEILEVFPEEVQEKAIQKVIQKKEKKNVRNHQKNFEREWDGPSL